VNRVIHRIKKQGGVGLKVELRTDGSDRRPDARNSSPFISSKFRERVRWFLCPCFVLKLVETCVVGVGRVSRERVPYRFRYVCTVTELRES
jgi:hypothetical protein